MGDFEKHIKLAKEKIKGTFHAYDNNLMTVVGDLGTKAVEQLIEADAAIYNRHFGDHKSRHEYSNKKFPDEINKAMRKVWFAYADLGYNGFNGSKAKKVIDNLKIVIKYFEKKFKLKIYEKNP
jgi:hypothetical protein